VSGIEIRKHLTELWGYEKILTLWRGGDFGGCAFEVGGLGVSVAGGGRVVHEVHIFPAMGLLSEGKLIGCLGVLKEPNK